jgi:type II protein arginine methyltransferase
MSDAAVPAAAGLACRRKMKLMLMKYMLFRALAPEPKQFTRSFFDEHRISAYARAIQSACQSLSSKGGECARVLDAGAGWGILSLVAAEMVQMGAQTGSTVTRIECLKPIAACLRDTVELNEHEDFLEILTGFEAEQRFGPDDDGQYTALQSANIIIVDAIDAALTSGEASGIVGDGWIDCLRRIASLNFRNGAIPFDSAVLIPSAVTVSAMIINAPPQAVPVSWFIGDVCGFDLRQFNDLAHVGDAEKVHLPSMDHTQLCAPSDMFKVPLVDLLRDLSTVNINEDNDDTDTSSETNLISTSHMVDVTNSGSCTAIAFWYTLHLGYAGEVSTSPFAASNSNQGRHIFQAVQMLPQGDAAMEVKQGQKIRLEAKLTSVGLKFNMEIVNDADENQRLQQKLQQRKQQGVQLRQEAHLQHRVVRQLRARLAKLKQVQLELQTRVSATDTLGEREKSQVSRWHFSMLHDHERNDAYQTAINEAVQCAVKLVARSVGGGAAAGAGVGGKGHDGEIHVLDIGAGSGLLSMMAARAAGNYGGHTKVKVTTCEAVPALAATARRIISTNGCSDAINVVGKHSTKLFVEGGERPATDEDDEKKTEGKKTDKGGGKSSTSDVLGCSGTACEQLPAQPDMSRRADVLISEILDTGLIGEHMLPSLNDAKRRLLQPNALMVPSKATVFAVAVYCPDQVYPASLPLSKIRVGRFQAQGFGNGNCGADGSAVELNMKCFNRFRTGGSSYEQVRLNELVHTALTPVFEAFHFDFTGTATPTPVERHAELVVPVEQAGKCNAIAFWFKLDLFTEGDGPGPVISTAPSDGKSQQHSSWNQAIQFLKKPLMLEAGKPLKLGVKHTPTCISFTPSPQ